MMRLERYFFRTVARMVLSIVPSSNNPNLLSLVETSPVVGGLLGEVIGEGG